MQVDNNFVTNKNVRSVNMFLKTLVVRMMAVFALMGILIGATPSKAAEKLYKQGIKNDVCDYFL